MLKCAPLVYGLVPNAGLWACGVPQLGLWGAEDGEVYGAYRAKISRAARSTHRVPDTDRSGTVREGLRNLRMFPGWYKLCELPGRYKPCLRLLFAITLPRWEHKRDRRPELKAEATTRVARPLCVSVLGFILLRQCCGERATGASDQYPLRYKGSVYCTLLVNFRFPVAIARAKGKPLRRWCCGCRPAQPYVLKKNL